jgi:hypothetical protein
LRDHGFSPSRNFGSKIKVFEALAKLLKARRKGHSGQAKHDPESRIFKQFWIPAPAPDPDPGFAGMTAQGSFARTLFSISLYDRMSNEK